MFTFWYKKQSQFPRGHTEYWRVRFIYHLLLVTSSMFALTAALNAFVFDEYRLATMCTVGALLSVTIYSYFRLGANLSVSAWLCAILLSTMNIGYIFASQGAAHSFVWSTLVPPMMFFLLGRNWGTLLTAIVMGCCTYIAYNLYYLNVTMTFSIGSVLNVLLASIALTSLFRFYEGTRQHAYKDLKQNVERTRQLAETDSLTGLFNREKFDQHLSLMLKRQRNDQELALFLIDIDHFKRINDEKGHLVGDEVLLNLATLLREQMRVGDMLARWGGEEFVIILPSTSSEQANEFAQRLRNMIKQHKFSGLNITVSIGISLFVNGDDSEDLFKRADMALYKAKENGRDLVVEC